jgi:hypothetical protein
VEGVVALRSFVDNLEELDMLKPILSPLLEGIFRLMNEVRGRGGGRGQVEQCARYFGLGVFEKWPMHKEQRGSRWVGLEQPLKDLVCWVSVDRR